MLVTSRRETCAPEGPGNFRFSRSSMPERSGRDKRTSMRTSSRDAGSCSSPAEAPLRPIWTVRVTSAAETPCSAALSRSTFMSYLFCGSSTYQSTSTTPGVSVENLLYLCRQFRLTFVVRPIHLSNESLQHWRTRWNLGDFDARAKWHGNFVQLGS